MELFALLSSAAWKTIMGFIVRFHSEIPKRYLHMLENCSSFLPQTNVQNSKTQKIIFIVARCKLPLYQSIKLKWFELAFGKVDNCLLGNIIL